MSQLLMVFEHAALPQKVVFVFLLASLLLAVLSAAAALGRRSNPNASLPFASKISYAALAVGLLVGALDAFHMMDTTLRLAVSPSAKDLAPGVMEIATLVGLGALSGLVGALVQAGSIDRPETSRSN
ncbi:hypothetical protein [Phenylobacterium aquaticum]|uniref:hypothetical protein n=1 Tax=Phenylobacterium aquaticum TaxID=1763816 RepID=UPI0026E99011|nr:hypothetical protein [Phenylobacterium aquaticum]